MYNGPNEKKKDSCMLTLQEIMEIINVLKKMKMLVEYSVLPM